MTVSATVRVRPATEGQDRPDQARLDEAARLLGESGFDILRIGRFGVAIRGEHADFLRVLGVNTAPNKSLSAAVEPPDQRLRKLIDLIEIVPPPSHY